MFTGLMPSEHGIYVSEDMIYNKDRDLARVGRPKMHKLKYGVLGEFSRHGYTTHIMTANPFITPHFGFKADDVLYVDTTGLRRWSLEQGQGVSLMQLIKHAKSGYLRRMFNNIVYLTKLFLNPKDKGGKFLVNYLRNWHSDKPFFLFINIMESHVPYARREILIRRKCFVKTIVDGKCPRECYYIASAYPRHAEYATSIALKIVDLLDDGNTLIVVTADHGQGLCDPVFGHSYWLTDSLLRVPLWVKFPNGKPPPQKGKYVPLTQIPDILRTALGENTTIGTNTTKAESFDAGFNNDILKLVSKDKNLFNYFVKKTFTYRYIVFE
ncbi:MAG: sulfatase-like hydrolase/transferase [Pyrobaculum sp.]